MSLCWEVWGPEEAGRDLALVKVSSHKVLAILAAVDSAIFRRTPQTSQRGAPRLASPHRAPGLRWGRQLSEEFLESPEQEGPSAPWALKLRSLMSGGAGIGLPLPRSTLSSWVGHARGRVDHRSLQTLALKVAREKQCPFWLGVRAPRPKGQGGSEFKELPRRSRDHPKATVRRWDRCPIPGRGARRVLPPQQSSAPAPPPGLPCPVLCRRQLPTPRLTQVKKHTLHRHERSPGFRDAPCG